MPIEKEKKSPEIKASPELVHLFLSDFSGQYAELHAGLKEESFEKVHHALTAILSGMRVVHLDAAIPLVDALQRVLEKAGSFPSEYKNELIDASQVLSSLLEATPENLYQMSFELAPAIEQRQEIIETTCKYPEEEKVSKKESKRPLVKPDVDTPMIDLFLVEVDAQVGILNQGLLLLESHKESSETYSNLMRAAHSLKGAAKVVGLEPLVNLGHEMEECFLYLKEQPEDIHPNAIDALFLVIDFFSSLCEVPKEFLKDHLNNQSQFLEQISSAMKAVAHGEPIQSLPASSVVAVSREKPGSSVQNDRILRVGSKSLNRLMGLAGESLIESLWLQPFGEALTSLKVAYTEITQNIELIRETLKNADVNERINSYLSNLQHNTNMCQKTLDQRLSELEMFIRRHTSLSERLYGEVIDIRMRPLMDGVKAFPRIVRDMGRDLGKKVRLEIIGETTPVDRDILERLETPLMHLLRNAVDHGIETPEERLKAGKPEEGVVTLEAMHRSGMLYITISDDGRGIDIEKIKKKLSSEKIVGEEVIASLNESELLDFLFLPGFSTAEGVTEISGRGMGLNIVQKMIQEVGGTIQTTTSKGHHLTLHLQLPITLSVIRAILVEISGEPYAFPLARIVRSIHLPQSKIEVVENHQYFHFEEKNIGLVQASRILKLSPKTSSSDNFSVIILADRVNYYGVVVDRFIGEKDLVVQEIDPILGKMPGISSGAFMEDGSPLLIIDVEDMLRSIDQLLYGNSLEAPHGNQAKQQEQRAKRVLIVDDSITVREVESRLLMSKGYEVQTAVDGVDGWNAVRIGQFDLVVTDVDMPRMNGIDLVLSIKSDSRLQSLPVMIVSYKDRDSDRQQGLAAGADYYLTKASFQDETLVDAVVSLIGPAFEPGRHS